MSGLTSLGHAESDEFDCHCKAVYGNGLSDFTRWADGSWSYVLCVDGRFEVLVHTVSP